ncbi:hypothetical protein FB192DRAFT_1382250 [Mucor lusitanicus]|uniref:Secreted protein n=1 Tax=Mucor circinelloides f. lusitanicus TaxID=29924 RepID=A0A8H4F1P2_MUCCL|nr:hypothetical protein FB192DRAFT_1382250 [Mucor lusitanicus]
MACVVLVGRCLLLASRCCCCCCCCFLGFACESFFLPFAVDVDVDDVLVVAAKVFALACFFLEGCSSFRLGGGGLFSCCEEGASGEKAAMGVKS